MSTRSRLLAKERERTRSSRRDLVAGAVLISRLSEGAVESLIYSYSYREAQEGLNCRTRRQRRALRWPLAVFHRFRGNSRQLPRLCTRFPHPPALRQATSTSPNHRTFRFRLSVPASLGCIDGSDMQHTVFSLLQILSTPLHSVVQSLRRHRRGCEGRSASADSQEATETHFSTNCL